MLYFHNKMGNCNTKHFNGPYYPDLKAATKQKLDELFEEIHDKVSIDYSKQEVVDIQTAVNTMLKRIVSRVNRRGWFKISSIQPCGSMVEKTTVWKFGDWTKERYTEMDFLAVLDYSPETKRHDLGCGQCIEVSGQQMPVRGYTELDFLNALDKSHDTSHRKAPGCAYCVEASLQSASVEDKDEQTEKENLALELYHHRYWSDLIFWRELNACMFSDCQCFSAEYDESSYRVSYKLSEKIESDYVCHQCAVDMPTGTLRVNEAVSVGPAGVANCSLAFRWYSKVKSLSAYDKCLQEQDQPMDSLTVHVDFLPALQLKEVNDHNIFLVPKKCNVCDRVGTKRKWRKWRKSTCMAEIDYIVNEMLDKHRKCYKIIKYILPRFMKFGINWYYVKTIVLNHSRGCSDSSEGCADCVLKMLTELKHAYETETLVSFNDPLVNIFDRSTAALFRSLYAMDDRIFKKMIERFCSIRSSDSCANLFQLIQ